MHENYMYYLFVKDVTKIGLIFFEPMFVLEKNKRTTLSVPSVTQWV